MTEITLPLPAPRLDSVLQPGVTDPVWPSMPPPGVDPDTYCTEYGGQLARQRHLHIVTANVTVQTLAELKELLARIAYFAQHQMRKPPATIDRRPYDPLIENRRVTVTLGLGTNLFTTPLGDDRFGLADLRPVWLKVLSPIAGDAASFSPRRYATDLIFLLASDDYYVNEYLLGLLYYGNVHPGIKVVTIERGYARPDGHEPSGFEDGSTNPRGSDPYSDMHRAVYIEKGDDEPGWCVGGTYLAYRKIQRRMKEFFALPVQQQEEVVGARKMTGQRLAAPSVCSHVFKLNPERSAPDLMGLIDEERRILRRPYFYDDGLDADGQELRGLHHLSFTRNLGLRYEWRIRMWQMNTSFPVPGSGADALYGDTGGARNVGGGYYFIPSFTHNGFHIH